MTADTSIARAFVPPRGFLVDLDGVVYHGDRVIPGAPPFFRFLRARGIPFLLTTNNSTLLPRQYVEKVARMDIEVAEAEVLASADATASYLRQQAPAGARVYVIGESGLKAAIEAVGLTLAESDVAVRRRRAGPRADLSEADDGGAADPGGRGVRRAEPGHDAADRRRHHPRRRLVPGARSRRRPASGR